jgi:hypothetical protein
MWPFGTRNLQAKERPQAINSSLFRVRYVKLTSISRLVRVQAHVCGSSSLEVVHTAVQSHGGVGGSLDSVLSVWRAFREVRSKKIDEDERRCKRRGFDELRKCKEGTQK